MILYLMAVSTCCSFRHVLLLNIELRPKKFDTLVPASSLPKDCFSIIFEEKTYLLLLFTSNVTLFTLFRYDTFVDVSGLTQKSHYFTHYSNPGGVLHYMVRVEPFTSLHVRLQGGKFDCADRQFYSIAKAWRTVESGSDVKELIPEFFFFPECFTNMNAFNFGCLQVFHSLN